MQITITKERLKSQVKIIREFLATKDFNLTQSSAYILLAKLHGCKDWNILSAILKNEEIL